MSDKFESLPIFQDAHSLTLFIYSVTKKFPADEKFALTSQIRRSASSIPANIIEGNARAHSKEFLEFLNIAKGSLEETKYHLLLAKDLGYLSEVDYNTAHEKCESIGRQLSALIKYWKNNSKFKV